MGSWLPYSDGSYAKKASLNDTTNKEQIMDYEAYKNTLPYPKKADFTTTFWYKGGKVIAKRDGDLSATQFLAPGFRDVLDLKDCITEVICDKDQYKAAMEAYNAETGRLQELFRQDFYAELGIELNPKRATLFSKAWEHGHSSGYSEVMNCGYDLVELIED
jgi:hypothetical protein